jgi:hypothetical protein
LSACSSPVEFEVAVEPVLLPIDDSQLKSANEPSVAVGQALRIYGMAGTATSSTTRTTILPSLQTVTPTPPTIQ